MDPDLNDRATVVIGVCQAVNRAMAWDSAQKGRHPAPRTKGEACQQVADQGNAQKYGDKVVAARTTAGQSTESTSSISNSDSAGHFIKYNIRSNAINPKSIPTKCTASHSDRLMHFKKFCADPCLDHFPHNIPQLPGITVGQAAAWLTTTVNEAGVPLAFEQIRNERRV